MSDGNPTRDWQPVTDETPPAVGYQYQYRNFTTRGEWSRPWRFERYDQPDVREPKSLEEARETLVGIAAGWVEGTEMRVLVLRAEPDDGFLATPDTGGK